MQKNSCSRISCSAVESAVLDWAVLVPSERRMCGRKGCSQQISPETRPTSAPPTFLKIVLAAVTTIPSGRDVIVKLIVCSLRIIMLIFCTEVTLKYFIFFACFPFYCIVFYFFSIFRWIRLILHHITRPNCYLNLGLFFIGFSSFQPFLANYFFSAFFPFILLPLNIPALTHLDLIFICLNFLNM